MVPRLNEALNLIECLLLIDGAEFIAPKHPSGIKIKSNKQTGWNETIRQMELKLHSLSIAHLFAID